MRAQPSIEAAVENAEGEERRIRAAVAVEPSRRRVVLNRFVVVRQVGPQSALEEGREIGQARERVPRRMRDRAERRPRPARHFACVSGFLCARSPDMPVMLGISRRRRRGRRAE